MPHPDLFLIKLIVTPAMMLITSLIVRKWGGLLGGMISGMPITSAPIMAFLALEQGTAFAAHTAAGALSGLASVLLTYLFYLFISRIASILLACIAAILFFSACSLILLQINSPECGLLLGLLAVLAILRFREILPATTAKPSKPGAWDIPLRMLTATSMLLIITSSAKTLGANLSGIFSPIPVIAWPLTVFSHIQSGRQGLIAIVKGNAIGALGVMVFYLVLKSLILRVDLLSTFAAAILASILVTLAGGWLVRLRRH